MCLLCPGKLAELFIVKFKTGPIFHDPDMLGSCIFYIFFSREKEENVCSMPSRRSSAFKADVTVCG